MTLQAIALVLIHKCPQSIHYSKAMLYLNHFTAYLADVDSSALLADTVGATAGIIPFYSSQAQKLNLFF